MASAGLTAGEVERLVRQAFADTPYPGDQVLVRSAGDEPAEVEALFRGRTDWRTLAPDFVDRAGAASPSALSFFSAGAFRFYLPAYLIADLAGRLVYTDPLFYLYFGLDNATRVAMVRVAGEGERSWWQVQQVHFADFTPAEAGAVVAYLRWKLAVGALSAGEQRSVAEALDNYWLGRAGSSAA